MSALPLGTPVSGLPRPLPVRVPHRGTHVALEPIHPRHAPDCWQAAQGADESWTYLGYGPFASEAAMTQRIEDLASVHDPLAYAVRMVASGRVAGWLTLLDIQPRVGSIELGHIWFSPALQRTRASTEAMFLLLRHAADDLGYRRLMWKCDALNARSRSAALRLGFVFEGILRHHLVVKGRRRDTAYFSILAEEWPSRREAIAAWLASENFSPDGTARRGLAEIRAGRGEALTLPSQPPA